MSIDRNNVFKRKTGFVINPKDWSASKGSPHPNDEVLKNLKTDLNNFRNKLEVALNKSNTEGHITNGDWLQEQIDAINNRTPIEELDILEKYVEEFIKNAHKRKNQKGGVGLSDSRVKSYQTFLNKMVGFQEKKNKKKIHIRDVSPALAEDFKDWLEEQGYSTNYVAKNIDNLKTICRDAEKNRIETHPDYQLIEVDYEKIPTEFIITLSFKELEKIKNTKLKHTALINSRKWLILGCYTGQRGSDLLDITENNLSSIDGMKIIELEQQKTGKMVIIPVLPEAEEIINSGLPYKISLQKFNNHLKDLCKEAEIDQPTKGRKRNKETNLMQEGVYPKYELIGSHVCRRSFATNYYGKIPTPILIGITGHSTERMFLKYIGKIALDNAKQMYEYVNKLREQESQDPRKHLSVVKTAN